MPTKLKESVSWPFAVGFALNFTWTSSVFFHSLLYTSAGHSFTFSSFYMASMAVLIVSLALMGVCSRAMAHSFSETGVLVVVGLILFAGTIAAANASDDSIQGMMCFWLGAVFTGIGSAYMLALWGWFLGSRAPHSRHQHLRSLCPLRSALLRLCAAAHQHYRDSGKRASRPVSLGILPIRSQRAQRAQRACR